MAETRVFSKIVASDVGFEDSTTETDIVICPFCGSVMTDGSIVCQHFCGQDKQQVVFQDPPFNAWGDKMQ